jgi:hypothetical protein
MFSKDKSIMLWQRFFRKRGKVYLQAKSHYQNSNGNYNKISNGLILSPQGEQVVCDYGKILLQ